MRNTNSSFSPIDYRAIAQTHLGEIMIIVGQVLEQFKAGTDEAHMRTTAAKVKHHARELDRALALMSENKPNGRQ